MNKMNLPIEPIEEFRSIVGIFTVIVQSADHLLDCTNRLSSQIYLHCLQEQGACLEGSKDVQEVSKRYLEACQTLLSIENSGENIPQSSSSHCERVVIGGEIGKHFYESISICARYLLEKLPYFGITTYYIYIYQYYEDNKTR